MPSLLLYGFLALAVLGALGGIYEAGSHSGAQDVRAEWTRQANNVRKAEQAKYQKAAEKKEQGDAQAKVVFRTITRTVDRIVEKPSYRNVCLDDDGLSVARAAIRGEIPDPGKPDKPVSAPARTGGRDRSLYLALDRGRF